RLKEGGDPGVNSAKVNYRIIPPEPAETVGGERARLRLDVISPAPASLGRPRRTDTLFRHEQEIKRYGGQMIYSPEDDHVTVSLELIRIRRVDNATDIQS